MIDPNTSKHRIFLAQPNAGSVMPGAVRGLYAATRDHAAIIGDATFGDIPHNFNQLWCAALRLRQNAGLTHFAMIHSDIRPPEFWLDPLLAEMDRVDADILSVVIAIKDGRGLSTTGIRYPGIWGTKRLTFKEIYDLPETFSIADTDEPDSILAINTGLWVCRFPVGWTDRFPGFYNKHRIVWRGGEPCPEFDSEDWLFSDWAASQGLRVFATRKLEAYHCGGFEYPNNGVWGAWQTELQPPTAPAYLNFDNAEGVLCEA